MNLKRYINMILSTLSLKDNIFYMERRTYKEGKAYKSYIIKIGEVSEEFRSERDLLLWLKELI